MHTFEHFWAFCIIFWHSYSCCINARVNRLAWITLWDTCFGHTTNSSPDIVPLATQLIPEVASDLLRLAPSVVACYPYCGGYYLPPKIKPLVDSNITGNQTLLLHLSYFLSRMCVCVSFRPPTFCECLSIYFAQDFQEKVKEMGHSAVKLYCRAESGEQDAFC
jgi:hypothetical protein